LCYIVGAPGELTLSYVNLNNNTRSLSCSAETDGHIYFAQSMDTAAQIKLAAGSGVLSNNAVFNLAGQYRIA
jgi:hypothetical protein